MSIIEQAQQVLRKACTPFGIVAALSTTDNYRRIWARDAVISGIAGILTSDEQVIMGLQQSILTLLAAQKKQGQIPSNLAMTDLGEVSSVSYGTMSARIDALCWWIIGAALIADRLTATQQEQLYLGIDKAIDLLEAWEYNGRGLVYVPMGGNWADEYVTQGYILYDQVLRAKALTLAAQRWQKTAWQQKADIIYEVINDNYWQPSVTKSTARRYRPLESDQKQQMSHLPYWICSLSPMGYDERFDLLGNALALLSPICTANQAASVLAYVEQLMQRYGGLVPTFYPIIYPNNTEWGPLNAHYLYRFKNNPGCFHNGGAWAMTMGWMGAAAIRWNRPELAAQLLAALDRYLPVEDQQAILYEYISPLDFVAGGVPNLCFSAAGILLLNTSPNCLEQLSR